MSLGRLPPQVEAKATADKRHVRGTPARDERQAAAKSTSAFAQARRKSGGQWAPISGECKADDRRLAVKRVMWSGGCESNTWGCQVWPVGFLCPESQSDSTHCQKKASPTMAYTRSGMRAVAIFGSVSCLCCIVALCQSNTGLASNKQLQAGHANEQP